MRPAYRPPAPSDAKFICQTWLKHWREQNKNRFIPRHVYFVEEGANLEALLAAVNVTVICNPDHPDQIFGWVAWSKPADVFVLHYAFVKRPYRRLGLFKHALALLHPRLFREEIAVTRMSKEFLEYGLKQKLRAIYNPYLEDLIYEASVR